MMTERPLYNRKPIGSTRALARTLDESTKTLGFLAARAAGMYPIHKIEGSGSERKVTYNPSTPLKKMQQKIIKVILASVSFPQYLNGGVKQRSYRDDCQLHVGAKTVISLDIATFFESVTEQEVIRIWKRFFHFSPEVAELLTGLTTHEGRLPRGAPTSSYLANLVFWDVEPRISANLKQQGVTYSRFVDDVSLSSTRYLKPQEISPMLSQIYGMFASKGVKPNRKKQRVLYANKGSVFVHDINVGGSISKMPGRVRKSIRAEVHNLARDMQQNGASRESLALMPHVVGNVSWMNQFHPEEAAKLREKLSLIEL